MPSFSALGRIRIQLTAPLAKPDFFSCDFNIASLLQQVFLLHLVIKAATVHFLVDN
jgi:hypothetical protein